MASLPTYNLTPPTDLKLKDGSIITLGVGTRVRLSDVSMPCTSIIIQAAAGNTNGLWVGGETVAVGRGIELAGAQSIQLYATNLDQIYLDTDTAGNTATYIYWSR